MSPDAAPVISLQKKKKRKDRKLLWTASIQAAITWSRQKKKGQIFKLVNSRTAIAVNCCKVQTRRRAEKPPVRGYSSHLC